MGSHASLPMFSKAGKSFLGGCIYLEDSLDTRTCSYTFTKALSPLVFHEDLGWEDEAGLECGVGMGLGACMMDSEKDRSTF